MRKVIIGLFVVLVVIVIIVSFLYLRKKRIHNIIQDSTLELVDDFTRKYPSTLVPVSKTGNRYTLAFSLYSKNVAENSSWNKKYDAPKGIISHYGSPNVYMIPKINTLRISIAYRDDLSNKTYYNFDLKDFRHQVWEHIVIVCNDRNVHIFLNGVMIKSMYLPNVPLISQNSFYIGQKNNNFNGKIRSVEYFNDALNIQEVEKLYNARK